MLALVGLGLVLSAVGTALSLALAFAAFFLFKVGPLVIVGWIVLKLLNRGASGGAITAADESWLERRR